MNTKHPFEWIKQESQKSVFVFLFIATLLVIVGMQFLGNPLITDAAPAGIVSYEFAGDLDTAQTIIDSWGQEKLAYAGLNLGLDYLFMAAYGLTIGLGCVLVAQGLQKKIKPLASLGILLAWGSVLAALLDALENYALIRVLLGSLNETWPVIAYWSAIVKFTLVGFVLIYIFVGALIALFTRGKK